MICQLFLKPKDEVVVPEYSFLMYRIYANIVDAKVKFAKEINYKISNIEILKKVTKKQSKMSSFFIKKYELKWVNCPRKNTVLNVK